MKTTECIEAWCGTRCGCYEQGKAKAIKEVLDIVKKELRCSQVLSKNHNVDTCILCNLRYNILQKIQALTNQSPNKSDGGTIATRKFSCPLNPNRFRLARTLFNQTKESKNDKTNRNRRYNHN